MLKGGIRFLKNTLFEERVGWDGRDGWDGWIRFWMDSIRFDGPLNDSLLRALLCGAYNCSWQLK